MAKLLLIVKQFVYRLKAYFRYFKEKCCVDYVILKMIGCYIVY